jgi:hypothetical protein
MIILSIFFIFPLPSYSETVDNLTDWGVPKYQQMDSLNSNYAQTFNGINGVMQYQVRDSTGGLVCIVESQNLDFYDHPITLNFFNSHPSLKIFETKDGLLHMIAIKDGWTVGQGDTFLSALRYAVEDYDAGQLYFILFATSNGCAVQPGDSVSIIWKILYIPN